ncbi:MAG: hypothetical protein QM472_08970 [Spirochaetota bacterium]|nr:hypothetical protein [Spirochaetota bacterium]OPZ38907.1 MAG: hypothetical protein BWY96_00690 [Spirochaetes bacterium ADurb.BinA120]HPV97366.1 hypothetical protein [Spirochaetota bacterium]
MDSLRTSRKVLLISDNKRASVGVRGALARAGLEVESRYLNLFSIPMIKKILARTGNTAFIRTGLFRFIREEGAPFAVVMDYAAGLGADLGDADGRKLLRTFLISYVILSRGRGFESLRANFLLLGTSRNMEEIERIERDPLLALDMIATGDAIVNSFVQDLRADRQGFLGRFLIRGLNAESPGGHIADIVGRFVQSVNDRARLAPAAVIGSAPSNEGPAARLLYRIDERRVWADGDISDVDSAPEYSALRMGEFYLEGYYTNRNLKEVGDKLKNAIGRGIATLKFDTDTPIVINMQDRCVTDAGTAASLAQILARDLAGYAGIRVSVSEENRRILEKSTGYNLLREYLRFAPGA